MSLTISLPPDLETQLLAQAKAQGIEVEQYVRSLLESHLLQCESDQQDWQSLLHQLGNSPSLADAPPLSDEAISRESIYGEREAQQL